ncbi:MAG: HAMP domain-containing protein [Campylobacterota bacterium]|nr:HAMP domain-containing protein [Campylobacterota bacterium]
MINLIKSKLRYKIMFFLFLLMTLSSFATMYITTQNIKKSNIKSTKKYLTMLNQSIFQSLRNSMNTGDPAQIKQAEEHAREINGVKSLLVAKSKSLIEIYSPKEPFTKDKDIINAFRTKKTSLFEYTQSGHDMRMIKPMIATTECLTCHANQKEGDVVGVIDLTFSLEDDDSELFTTILNVFITSTILGWITLLVTFVLLKKSTKPIETLEEAIKALTKGSNSGRSIHIKSNDEIGNVARYFNKYIQKIKDSLDEDDKLIKEAKIVIETVKHGEYSKTIKLNTSNQSLEEFKEGVNEMIEATREHLTNMNLILQEYSNHDYRKELKLAGINKGSLFEKSILDIYNVPTKTNHLV